MAHDPILDDLSITDLSDATAVALELSDLFGGFATAVGLAADGAVRDLTVFTDDRATLDTALDWAHCLVVGDPRVTRIVLMSSATDTLEVLAEGDLDEFRHARDLFAVWDVEIVDWVQTDGESVRSMRVSEGGRWP